jgi:hypothetical protein
MSEYSISIFGSSRVSAPPSTYCRAESQAPPELANATYLLLPGTRVFRISAKRASCGGPPSTYCRAGIPSPAGTGERQSRTQRPVRDISFEISVRARDLGTRGGLTRARGQAFPPCPLTSSHLRAVIAFPMVTKFEGGQSWVVCITNIDSSGVRLDGERTALGSRQQLLRTTG